MPGAAAALQSDGRTWDGVRSSLYEMEQVADNTFRLGSSGHNYYVLRDGDQAMVIDAGCSREWSKLLGGLQTLGLSLESVVGIAATHSHADHFGFAKEATENGVTVSVHEDEETRAKGTYTGRYAASASDLPIFNINALKTFLPLVIAGVMKLDHVDEVATFADGQRLDVPGRPVVIHTPGHTEGHAMFHCAELGILFTGDGLITMDLIGPGRGPQMIEKRFNLDHDQALASLDRVVGLEAALLLPGHGDPWGGSPAEAVELARR